MALANVGVLLAREGYKVLCIDWDLEAPGLGRYLATVPRSVLDTKPHLTAPKRPGGLLAILEESKPGQLTKWQDYLHVRIGTNGTKFDFIGSGDNEDGYSEKLGCFSWSDFFAQRSGGDIIESLRDEWREIYDYVLIDSRTGLTDSSGVTTIQMPDLVVMLFAANNQNVDWCRRVARSIREGRKKLPYERTFLPIIPLLSRFDAREESDRAAEAMDRIAETFAPFFSEWLPRSVSPRDMVAWSVLPYIPRYSFEESLAVEDEPETGAQGLSFYYRLLSRLISSRFYKVRAILAEVGVPGAVLPTLLPSTRQLDTELQRDPSAIQRYTNAIRERAEEEPIEAAKALEIIANAFFAMSRLDEARKFLTEAINILSDPAVAKSEEVSRLKQKRQSISHNAIRPRVFISYRRIDNANLFRLREFCERLSKCSVDVIFDLFYLEENPAGPSEGWAKWCSDQAIQADRVLIVGSQEWFQTFDGIELPGSGLGAAQEANELRQRIYGASGVDSAIRVVFFDDTDSKNISSSLSSYPSFNANSDFDQIVNWLGGTLPVKEMPEIREIKTSIPHNLPALQPFFGREEELRQIAMALDPESRTWGALIDGPGGMGKTSLAVRAAYAVPKEDFDRILFVSLKTRELDDDGVRDLSGYILSGLTELLGELARQLERNDIVKQPEERRPRLLLEALRDTRTLLILDNIESLLKKERDTIFTFVNRLPFGCKAILTTRGRIGSGATELILGKLSEEAALQTLDDLAKYNALLAQTSEAERLILYRETGGLPLLLRWTAGQIGRGHCLTFTDAIAYLRSCPPGNDPLEYVFGDLVEDFTVIEMRVVCALTFFTRPAKVKHIAAIAGIEATPRIAGSTERGRSATSLADIEGALRSLVNRSLAVPNDELTAFSLVPMVAEFLRNKRPEIIAEISSRLELRAYALIMENGRNRHERFPVLDSNWPSVSPALPRFLAGPNARLQELCIALDLFLNFTGRWDECLALSQQAEARAVSVGDHYNAGWRAYQAGTLYFLRQQADAVLACADRTIGHWKIANVGARERAFAIRLRGLGYQLKGEFSAAISAYRDVLELRVSEDPGGIDVANTLNDLAGIESECGDLAAADQHYREALRLATMLDYTEGVASFTSNLAALELDRKNWYDAERLSREALFLSEKLGSQELIACSSNRLAKSLVHQGKRSEALLFAHRAVEIYTRIGSPDIVEARETLRQCKALHSPSIAPKPSAVSSPESNPQVSSFLHSQAAKSSVITDSSIVFSKPTNEKDLPFTIKLGKSYYFKGFINVPSKLSDQLGKHDDTLVFFLGRHNPATVITKIDRKANTNGSPRLYGGQKVALWFQKHFQEGDKVKATIVSANEIVLEEPEKK